ncbi:MAG: DNA mismatch repair protein MutS [Cytophagales bacterium]|nr:DNA mismatch repair protein MutS [Bernardetiaceae bacterium]MDW8209870.1 DNA mismatch repair protein MutS [Cytophagales bacterium]
MNQNETPLMRQYNAFKAQYPGALLLFRVGDFYETFGEDAIRASRILDITLTKRANGAAAEVPLAGFPYHALDVYLPKLIKAGERVAICDQLEDPRFAKGLVKRGVTELITPGIVYHDQALDRRRNNYLCALHLSNEPIGIAFLDISTGEFLTTQGNLNYIQKLLQNFAPAEIIFSKSCKKTWQEKFADAGFAEKVSTFPLDEWVFQRDYAYEKLTRHFETLSLKGFGIHELSAGIIAAGAVLYYLEVTEHKEIKHISSISRIEEAGYVWLDRFTLRNLELLSPQQEGGVSLLEVLDQTQTPMGARLLKKWIALPLCDKHKIDQRLEAVDYLVTHEDFRQGLLQLLSTLGDMERVISKVAAGRVNPREMQQLRRWLLQMHPLKTLLAKTHQPIWQQWADQINPCEFLVEKIGKELSEEAPALLHQGNLIKSGVNQELDQLREIASSSKDFLKQILEREIRRTGIHSLKINYNKVFGYYIEVSNAHKDKVPADWIRKQTLANAERYVTEELKNYEEKILTAEDKIAFLEQEIFHQLVQTAASYVLPVQQNARVIATLDCLLSFAQTAVAYHYARPVIGEYTTIDIKAGRHPVIERQLPPGEEYIPNDLFLDTENQQILIITGPNMAGKSALLRQTALIVLMAQMGSFVPAAEAKIGLVDKVFTRVGATDNLSRGESTFMVEMTETASILNNLSQNSLLIMDEIGRGTSTYDGISIAWAIVEYLHNHPRFRPKTLFATHYHELNALANQLPRVKNFNIAVKEANGKIIFLRKLVPGGSQHSFGIHVAQLAGIPNWIVIRAYEIMQHLEKDEHRQQQWKTHLGRLPKPQVYQMSLFEDSYYAKVKEMLQQLDINTISPVEALLKLNELKNLLGK